MLVVKDRKKLLLNLKDPGRIMALVPGARQLTIKGHEIVAVPHTQDVVKVLRNVGIPAPGPIMAYYNWPCFYPAGPFVHQRSMSEFASLSPRAYILSEMGTAKTASALWAFDWLRKQGLVDSCVVIAPLSALERAWGDEIFRNFADMSFGVVHGIPDKRIRMIQSGKDVLITNHDGLQNKKVLVEFLALPGRVLVIVDELAIFRHAGTERWKLLNTFLNGNKKLKVLRKEWVWGMTGTPMPKEPVDAWAQCKLITPWTVPQFMGAFRNTVMKKIEGTSKWVPRHGAIDEVFRVMQPGIRFKRDECLDLPPMLYATRDVAMTGEQARMYHEMMKTYKAEFEGGQITAMNEGVKIGKLLQIVCGLAYSPAGNMVIPAKPRTDEVLELIEEAGAKVIVYVPLVGALQELARVIGEHYQVEIVHGGVSKAKRDQIFADFQDPNGFNVLVAQPQCMAHSLSLTAASTIIWYAPVHSAETYQQANDRIPRPGQKNHMLVVRLQGSPLEKRMYAKLERRTSAQNSLLEMFREQQ